MADPAGSSLRIVHCPTDVGGHPGGLAAAERAEGADSTVVTIQRSGMRFPVDVDLALGARSRPGRLLGRAAFVARSLRRYEIYHFNFGQSMLPRLGSLSLDLPLLRAAGKRLFMTFQGCDARSTQHCLEHYEHSCCDEPGPGVCRPEGDRDKRNAVRCAVRHCHRRFCLNPELLPHVPGSEFVPYASVDPATIVPAPPRDRAVPLIVHAPTHRLVKGTRHLLDAVDAIRRDRDVELRLVEDMVHEEALAAYRDADIVVDQLKAGWYGGFAVEVMAMGKPVISYIRTEELHHLPPCLVDELPVVSATPTTIEGVLRKLLDDPERCRDIGERSRRFVERWHDPRRIARRMLAIYADPARRFWDGFDPDD